MKTIAFFLLVMLAGLSGWTQTRKATHPKHENLSVKTYSVDSVSEDMGFTFLGMDYGSARFLNPEALMTLPAENILRIDLVYSGYPTTASEKQEKLNKARMDSLLKVMPFLTAMPTVKWRWVKQEDCHNSTEAKDLFHGFAVTWAAPGGHLDPNSNVSMRDRIHKAMEKGMAEKKVDSASAWMLDKKQFDLYVKEQTLVEQVMNRHPEWKKKLIVQDVTGSMLPYYEQVILWHALNGTHADIQSYVFFNDGDLKPDAEKKVGKTGGLYYTAEQDIDKVMDTLFNATMNGGGGDLPENNIEAVLEGLRKYPGSGEVIMIADNWATPRDMSLLQEVKRPVRVVLCGAWMGVNPEYLNIARETGGSIHTAEADLDALFEMKEGEIIRLREQAFKIQDGVFVPVVSL